MRREAEPAGAPAAEQPVDPNPYAAPKPAKKAKLGKSSGPPAIDLKGVTRRFGSVVAVNARRIA